MSRGHAKHAAQARHELIKTLEGLTREEYVPPPTLRRLIPAKGCVQDLAEVFRGILEMAARIGAASPAYFFMQDGVHMVVYDPAGEARELPRNWAAGLLFGASNRHHGKTLAIYGDVLLCPRSDMLL